MAGVRVPLPVVPLFETLADLDQAPATLAADYSLTLPADDGLSGQVLATDGSGTLSWSAGTGAGERAANRAYAYSRFDQDNAYELKLDGLIDASGGAGSIGNGASASEGAGGGLSRVRAVDRR